MQKLVSYQYENSVSTITLDDGKMNVMSVAMLKQLNAAIMQAETDGGVLIITGREGVLSAGFDLAAFKRDKAEVFEMLSAGAKLTETITAFPTPVIVACTGHAIAMGLFIVLSADYRFGINSNEFSYAANEVAIGMTVPHFAKEVCLQKFTPAAFNRAVTTAEYFSSSNAVDVGILDAVVDKDDLHARAEEKAIQFTKLDLNAYQETQLRIKKEGLQCLNNAIRIDVEGWKSRML